MNQFRLPLGSASMSRREVLRSGGLVVSIGALVAACGSGRSGSDAPGRLGVADPLNTLPPTTELPDDVTLLRTAQSLEHTVLAVHAEALKSGVFSSAETALAERFVADHEAHAAAVGGLITAAGGSEFACPNPFLMERSVEPILAALEGSDDPRRDVLNIAHAFETLAGASYQALVPMFASGELRAAAARIAGDENRHSAALALAINPGEPFAPTFTGGAIAKNADGFFVPYAIPSVFGKVAGIDLVVGKTNDEGTRFSTQLQTPAANTLVYEYQAC